MENAFIREKAAEQTQRNFLYQVYAYMGIGLALTGFTSWISSLNQGLMDVLFLSVRMGGFPVVYIALAIGLVAYVWYISSHALNMTAFTAAVHMVLYSVLTGVMISYIFLIYTDSSIFLTFLITAAMFFSMSLYGWTTKADLSRFGNILIMGVWGLILMSVLNWLFQSPVLYYIIGAVGVVVFAGLAAYDSQKLKALSNYGQAGSEEEKKGALLGALILYLDFINLFLMLLRLFGSRR